MGGGTEHLSGVSRMRGCSAVPHLWLGLLSLAPVQRLCCVFGEVGTSSDGTSYTFPAVARSYQLCPDVKYPTGLICFMFSRGLSCYSWSCNARQGSRSCGTASVCWLCGCCLPSRPCRSFLSSLGTAQSVGPALLLAKQPRRSSITYHGYMGLPNKCVPILIGLCAL